MKMNNRSHRYNINKPRSKHGHKYNNCKKCLIMTMFICIEQDLRKLLAQFMKKLSNTEPELE